MCLFWIMNAVFFTPNTCVMRCQRRLARHGQRSSTRVLQVATVYVGPEEAGQLSPTKLWPYTSCPVVTLPASQVARWSELQLLPGV